MVRQAGELPLSSLFLALVTFRILNTFLVQTSFDPDEYWQGPEIAHRTVFGYGYLTWEWWPQNALRGYLHPILFAALYKFLDIFSLDSPFLVQWSPRILQSVLAAAGDLSLYRLAQSTIPTSSHWALCCQLVNWFTFYSITRTYSSSLEAVLTTAALSFWPSLSSPRKQAFRSRPLALCLAAVGCVIRPTNAIIWIFLGTWELATCTDPIALLVFQVLPIGAVTIAVSTCIDSWVYGQWSIAPLNFLRFNFLTQGASAYGTHPWHWYFIQGLPVMLLTFFPFSITGALSLPSRLLPMLVLWCVGVLSLIPHKEFRFLLPVLPLCNIFAGHGISLLRNNLINLNTSTTPPKNTQRQHSTTKESSGDPSAASGTPNFPILGSKEGPCRGVPQKQARPWLFLAVIGPTIMIQVGAAAYFCLVHQRGSLAVMRFLRQEMNVPGRVSAVAFLMPCHSTPFYSHTHSPTPMSILDCSPQFTRAEEGMKSETQQFIEDPLGFVTSAYGDSQELGADKEQGLDRETRADEEQGLDRETKADEEQGLDRETKADEEEGLDQETRAEEAKEGVAPSALDCSEESKGLHKDRAKGKRARGPEGQCQHDSYIAGGCNETCSPDVPSSLPGFCATQKSLPSHIVVFPCEEHSLRPFFLKHEYSKVATFFHRHIPIDRDCESHILVYVLKLNLESGANDLTVEKQ